jgi:hypothetical protein
MQNEAWQQPTASRQRSRHDCVVVALADGRTISVPLAFYPRLLHATPHQRSNWQLAGGGYGIHCPEPRMARRSPEPLGRI